MSATRTVADAAPQPSTIVAECAVAIARLMDEGWAGYVVSGMMAATGSVGRAWQTHALTRRIAALRYPPLDPSPATTTL